MHQVETVMLIDDSTIDRWIYTRCMERSGMIDQIICFGGAKSALDHLMDPDAVRPDLILLDLRMPETDGFAFLRQLEAMTGSMPPPVVMLTTSLSQSDRALLSQHDAVRGFVSKPLTKEHMLRLARLVATPVVPSAIAEVRHPAEVRQ